LLKPLGFEGLDHQIVEQEIVHAVRGGLANNVIGGARWLIRGHEFVSNFPQVIRLLGGVVQSEIPRGAALAEC
jgi:hypothetical protein